MTLAALALATALCAPPVDTVVCERVMAQVERLAQAKRGEKKRGRKS